MRISNTTLSTKLILIFFITVIIVTLILAGAVFISKHAHLQDRLTYLTLQQTVENYAVEMDQKIKRAEQNAQRLSSYIAILNTELSEQVPDTRLNILKQMMTENLQFDTDQFGSFIALEPEIAQHYFNREGSLIMVQKNIAQRQRNYYNKPQHMILEWLTDTSYMKEPWYRDAQKTPNVQFTAIYENTDYIKEPVFNVIQGLYKQRTFEGVIGVSLLVDSFFEEIESKSFGKSGGLFLADYQSGELLSKIGSLGSPQLQFLKATERRALNLYKESGDLAPAFWRNLLNHNTPYREMVKPEGYQYTVSSRKLGALPWTLVGYQRTSELKAGEGSSLIHFIFLVVVVICILTVMAGVLYKLLLQPLQKILVVGKEIVEQPPEKLTLSLKGVVEMHLLMDILSQIVTRINKTTNDKNQCINRLHALRSVQSEQLKQVEQYRTNLEKASLDVKNYHAETQKARLQLQKARVEIQKHKLEAQRSRVQAQAAAQAKAQFLANMSHELRTPMNAIIGYTEILQEDARDQGYDEFIPDLQKIHGASYHLLDLINNLFDMSKIESSKMELYIETFDIAPMLQDISSTVMPLLEKQSNILKIDCDNALGTMTTDLTKVRQNLLNLLSNANKFSKQNTIILMVTRETVEDIDWIIFQVTDHGIGMTAVQMQKLFQAFTQVDSSPTRRYGGSGLGLAITKQFCQIMGGDITVQSQFGQGTTFIMRLPAEISSA